MEVNLPEPLERFLREAVAGGRFASIDQAVAMAVGRLELDEIERRREREHAGPVVFPEGYKPHWEVAQEITADIPPEVWAKIPVDSSEQHDHYIFGTPKRPQPTSP
jgi:Arc/MetJ-type ribon-helix-helix transcriptional regulator